MLADDRAARQRARRPRRHRADGHRRVGLAARSPSTPTWPRGSPDRGRTGRSSRRWPATTPACFRGRDPHRDALRAQPDRRLALARRARRDRRLPGRRRGARRHPGRPAGRRDAPTGSSAPGCRRRRRVARRCAASRSRTAASPGVEPDAAAAARERLAGLTVPGLANCHSHAFHRALRGRTQRERGTFWTWREQMYAVAGRLDPDTYFELAPGDVPRDGRGRHHQRRRVPLPAPRPRRHAVRRPERDGRSRSSRPPGRPGCGSRCSTPATSRPGSAGRPEGVQRGSPTATRRPGPEPRPSDCSSRATGGRRRRGRRRDPLGARGAAATRCRLVADWAGPPGARCTCTSPSRSPRTTPAWRPTARTPTELLAEAGALGDAHQRRARHPPDRRATSRLLGGRATSRLLLPHHRARPRRRHRPVAALHEAGAPLTLGCDSHAVVDLFEEMRAVELDERLATQQRGHWSAGELLRAATSTGTRRSASPDAGRIAVGARADLVTLDTAQPPHRRHAAPTRRPPSSPPPPPTSCTWSRRAVSWSTGDADAVGRASSTG